MRLLLSLKVPISMQLLPVRLLASSEARGRHAFVRIGYMFTIVSTVSFQKRKAVDSMNSSWTDAFAKAFTEKVSKFTIGPGSQKGVTHGPLIHSRAMNKAKEHTEDALQKGGKLLHGGHAIPFLGPNFFELTVVGNVTPDMKIAHEETFGPVAALFPFETEEEVIERANDSDVGLAGYFYSHDIHRCYRVAEALEVGMVGINTGIVSDPVMPFGGVKESGFGREGSRQGIDEYIVTKAVTLGGCK